MKSKKKKLKDSKYNALQGLMGYGGETASNKMPLNNSFELPVALQATCRVKTQVSFHTCANVREGGMSCGGGGGASRGRTQCI